MAEYVSGKTVTGGLREAEWQGVGDFVTAVLRTYHSHFWLYFQITAPAVIISTIAIITARNEAREISRHLPRGVELLAHHTEILEIGLINYSAWFVSWIAFSFVFGAICIASGRKRGRIYSISMEFFRTHSGTVESFPPCIFASLGSRSGNGRRFDSVGDGCLLDIAPIAGTPLWLSGLGGFMCTHGSSASRRVTIVLAVPAVILDDFSVVRAMLRSDELTQGKWLALAALLAKSLIGGYVAGMCPFWLASFVRVSVPLPSWFPWILTIASVIGVTVVEPTMFVGFALLYLKASATDSAPSRVLASQLT